jgi:hypothetical protein
MDEENQLIRPTLKRKASSVTNFRV